MPRILALSITVVLALPPPAHALRNLSPAENAGLEETLARSLSQGEAAGVSSSGLEEKDQGTCAWAMPDGSLRTFRMALEEEIKKDPFGPGFRMLRWRLYEGDTPVGFVLYNLRAFAVDKVEVEKSHRGQGLSTPLLLTFFQAMVSGRVPGDPGSVKAYVRQPLSGLAFRKLGFKSTPLPGDASRLAFTVTIGPAENGSVPLYAEDPKRREQMKQTIAEDEEWAQFAVVDQPIPSGQEVLLYAGYQLPEGSRGLFEQRLADPRLTIAWQAGLEEEQEPISREIGTFSDGRPIVVRVSRPTGNWRGEVLLQGQEGESRIGSFQGLVYGDVFHLYTIDLDEGYRGFVIGTHLTHWILREAARRGSRRFAAMVTNPRLLRLLYRSRLLQHATVTDNEASPHLPIPLDDFYRGHHVDDSGRYPERGGSVAWHVEAELPSAAGLEEERVFPYPELEAAGVKGASAEHIGLRPRMADSHGVLPLRRSGHPPVAALGIVADGVGSGEYSAQASGMVVDQSEKSFTEEGFVRVLEEYRLVSAGNRRKPAGIIRREMRETIRRINRELLVRQDAVHSRELRTTVVTALLVGDTVFVAHVGDSRAYLQRRDRPLRLLTADDGEAWKLARAEQPRVSNRKIAQTIQNRTKNALTQAVGFSEPEVHLVQVEGLRKGDRILLASDGLSDAVGEEGIARLLMGGDDLTVEEIARGLMGWARNGLDNRTAVVLECRYEPPAAGLEEDAEEAAIAEKYPSWEFFDPHATADYSKTQAVFEKMARRYKKFFGLIGLVDQKRTLQARVEALRRFEEQWEEKEKFTYLPELAELFSAYRHFSSFKDVKRVYETYRERDLLFGKRSDAAFSDYLLARNRLGDMDAPTLAEARGRIDALERKIKEIGAEKDQAKGEETLIAELYIGLGTHEKNRYAAVHDLAVALQGAEPEELKERIRFFKGYYPLNEAGPRSLQEQVANHGKEARRALDAALGFYLKAYAADMDYYAGNCVVRTLLYLGDVKRARLFARHVKISAAQADMKSFWVKATFLELALLEGGPEGIAQGLLSTMEWAREEGEVESLIEHLKRWASLETTEEKLRTTLNSVVIPLLESIIPLQDSLPGKTESLARSDLGRHLKDLQTTLSADGRAMVVELLNRMDQEEEEKHTLEGQLERMMIPMGPFRRGRTLPNNVTYGGQTADLRMDLQDATVFRFLLDRLGLTEELDPENTDNLLNQFIEGQFQLRNPLQVDPGTGKGTRDLENTTGPRHQELIDTFFPNSLVLMGSRISGMSATSMTPTLEERVADCRGSNYSKAGMLGEQNSYALDREKRPALEALLEDRFDEYDRLMKPLEQRKEREFGILQADVLGEGQIRKLYDILRDEQGYILLDPGKSKKMEEHTMAWEFIRDEKRQIRRVIVWDGWYWGEDGRTYRLRRHVIEREELEQVMKDHPDEADALLQYGLPIRNAVTVHDLSPDSPKPYPEMEVRLQPSFYAIAGESGQRIRAGVRRHLPDVQVVRGHPVKPIDPRRLEEHFVIPGAAESASTAKRILERVVAPILAGPARGWNPQGTPTRGAGLEEKMRLLLPEQRGRVERFLAGGRVASVSDVTLPDTLTLYAQGTPLFEAVAQRVQDWTLEGIRFDTTQLPPTRAWAEIGLIFQNRSLGEEPVNNPAHPLPVYPLTPEEALGLNPDGVVAAIFRSRLGIPESQKITWEFYRDAEGRVHALVFA